MNFLFDTNAFIALEPTRLAELETSILPELLKLIIDGRHGLYLHPAQRLDVGRDRDDERRALRQILFDKYPLLSHPPTLSLDAEALLGRAAPSSNDWVDHQLLGALAGDAIDVARQLVPWRSRQTVSWEKWLYDRVRRGTGQKRSWDRKGVPISLPWRRVRRNPAKTPEAGIA